MTAFMRAHGYLPAPTHRPVTTGTIAGLIGGGAALAISWCTGATAAMTAATGAQPAWHVALGQVLMLGAIGGLYGRIFQRAADDRRGGWLLGIGYGFVVWMLGPAAIMPWALGRPVAVGLAAQGLIVAHLVYGLILGATFPWVHLGVRWARGVRGI